MKIQNRIIEEAGALAEGLVVKDVRIGLGYSSVLLSNGGMGLAYTFHNETARECTVFTRLHPIAGNSALSIIKMLDSDDSLAATVALATANAIFSSSEQDYTAADILSYLTLHADDKVCMIGNFRPLVQGLKERVASCEVFERAKNLEDGLLPAERAFDHLPGSSVAIITSTSIINSTIDPLLEAAKNCREVIMLGASTPLCPAVFRGSPVTMLSGMVVKDKEKVLQTVSEGGGVQIFKNFVKKVNLEL